MIKGQATKTLIHLCKPDPTALQGPLADPLPRLEAGRKGGDIATQMPVEIVGQDGPAAVSVAHKQRLLSAVHGPAPRIAQVKASTGKEGFR